MDILPEPITNLFSLNNEMHNFNTRYNQDLQINTGRGDLLRELIENYLAKMIYYYVLLIVCNQPMTMLINKISKNLILEKIVVGVVVYSEKHLTSFITRYC